MSRNKYILRKKSFFCRVLPLAVIILTIISIFIQASLVNPTAEAKTRTPATLEKPSEDNHYYQNSSFPSGADPGIIKVDNTYYLYTTGGNGYQICGQKTTDFRQWEGFCYSVDKNGYYDSIWAPEVYYYQGKYYLFFTAAGDGEFSIRGAVSDSPEGPFRDTFTLGGVYSGFVIDHTIFFDDDGSAYLYKKLNVNGGDGCAVGWCNSVIFVERLSSDLRSVVSDSAIALEQESINGIGNLNYIGGHYSPIDGFNYWENGCIEAPSVIKKNGKYYLIYSVGHFESLTYAVGYAESSSPFGRFNKVTLGNNGGASTAPLLHGLTRGDNWYGLDVRGPYGTGHGYVLDVGKDEMYYVYHSRSYGDRKLNMDYLGIDSSGKLFINGPTNEEKNPAPSGVNKIYRYPKENYTVATSSGTIRPELNDYINLNARNSGDSIGKTPLVEPQYANAKGITITLKNPKTIGDVWLFAGSEELSGKATVSINGSAKVGEDYPLSGKATKIQLPTDIGGTIQTIEMTFSGKISLSEVQLYTVTPNEGQHGESSGTDPDNIYVAATSRCGEGVDVSLFGDEDNCYYEDEEGSGIFMILDIALNTLSYGIAILAVLGIVLSAIQYISAGDDVAMMQKAKKHIFQIVIGLAIYAVFWGILQFLLPGGLF